LGDLADLGFEGAPAVLELGVALSGKVFWGLGEFTRLGEPLVSLGLGGLVA
jgi:hypothetical protein